MGSKADGGRTAVIYSFLSSNLTHGYRRRHIYAWIGVETSGFRFLNGVDIMCSAFLASLIEGPILLSIVMQQSSSARRWYTVSGIMRDTPNFNDQNNVSRYYETLQKEHHKSKKPTY